MNRKTLILFILLLTIAAALFFTRINNGDEVGSARSDASVDAATVDGASVDDAAATSAASKMKRGNDLNPDVFCNGNSECIDDPLVPNSEEELRWMQRHGYPTKDELERLTRLSDVELEEEAKRGMLTAMTALGTRMIDRGDNNGLSWYVRASEGGSIYVYYGLSDATMRIKRPGYGLSEAGAYLRLAYLLGDHKASLALYRFMEKERMGMIEMDVIDRRASSLYKTFAKSRPPSPRPQ